MALNTKIAIAMPVRKSRLPPPPSKDDVLDNVGRGVELEKVTAELAEMVETVRSSDPPPQIRAARTKPGKVGRSGPLLSRPQRYPVSWTLRVSEMFETEVRHIVHNRCAAGELMDEMLRVFKASEAGKAWLKRS